LALTKREAAAEISPEIADSRSAAVTTGTSEFATFCSPDSVAENDTMAMPAATTVMAATAPKAICSLNLMPKPFSRKADASRAAVPRLAALAAEAAALESGAIEHFPRTHDYR
jgi:hypothetical protein